MHSAAELDRFLRAALAEDVGPGDLTSELVLPADRRARGLLKLRSAGVLAGLEPALRVFALLAPDAEIVRRAADGDAIAGDTVVAEVLAPARALLSGERLALNLLGRLCGVATLTRAYVRAVAGTGAAIVDTRKTTPLLRALEKDAVRHGGGTNHRMGLYDAILVKDNHLDLAGVGHAPERIAALVADLRARAPAGTFLQLEARTEEEALAVARGGADSVLFDNFAPDALARAVPAVRAAATRAPFVLEASGGITLDTVRAFAATGVDRISIGALTHSARALDVTLDVAAA